MRFLPRIVLSASLLFASALASAATVFSFSDFSNCAGLQLNGVAACTGGVLRLTPALVGQSGSTFSTTQVPLGSGASFSTFFSFRMTAPGGINDEDGAGADGIVFVVQPVASTVGTGGGGLGYSGIPTSIGIEFDTFNNGPPTDADGNHVGVDLNGSVQSVIAMPVATRLNDGNIWNAWIDYDGTTIELRISQSATRPASPTLSFAVNLASVLGTSQAFVGFTGGTGTGFENQDILSWQFNNAFSPIVVNSVAVQVPALSTLAVALIALLLVIAAAVAFRRRAA